MQTLESLIDSLQIEIDAERASDNPLMPRKFNHWAVTLSRPGASCTLTVRFSMGPGLGNREPEIAEVLDCLISDSSTVENTNDLEDFASEFGYDLDDPEVEAHTRKVYKACESQRADLRAFLADHYESALYETERL